MSTRLFNRQASTQQPTSLNEPQRRARRKFFDQMVKHGPRRLFLEPLEDRRVMTNYVVTVLTDDAADASGVADTDLSLREAIIAANTNAAFGDAPAGQGAGDTITFAGALAGGTILMGNGQFSITDDLSINGNAGVAGTRITIDAGAASRIFDVLAGGGNPVTLESLTLRNGNVVGDGGAIRNNPGSTLNVTNSIIQNNVASNAGGGIENQGTLVVTGTTIQGSSAAIGGGINSFNATATVQGGSLITNNTSTTFGGGIEQQGGTLTVDNSTVSNNTANNGGGIDVGPGTATVQGGSIITGNTATANGGGLFVGIGSQLNVNASTVSNNDAVNGAGISSDGDLNVDSSTLDGNQATGDGGGIRVSSTGDLFLNNTFVTNNTANQGGGVHNAATAAVLINAAFVTDNIATTLGGGIFAAAGTTVTIQTNSSVSRNDAGTDGGGIHTAGMLTLNSALMSQNTATGNGGGLFVTGTGTALIQNISAVSSGSANIGGGVFNAGLLTVNASFINFNTAALNAGGIANLGTAMIQNGSTVASNVATANGGGIFNQNALTINASSVTQNSSSGLGGGITTAAGSTNTINVSTISTNTANQGAGIANQGTTTVNGGTIDGNIAATEGGGVWNSASGTLNLFDTATVGLFITNNDAQGNAPIGVGGVDTQGGGGVFNDGGTLTIDGSAATPVTFVSINNNRASGLTTGSGGGLLSIAGTVGVTFATIIGNEAVRAGGGIEIITGNVNLNNINLANNDVSTAGAIAAVGPGNGGGLHTTGAAVVNITSAFISGNAAGAEGGGLWNSATGTMILNTSTTGIQVQNNVANGNLDASGNIAFLQGGGGIFNDGNGLGAGGTLTLTGPNIIVSNNRATGLGGAGLTAGSGGGLLSIGGIVSITNSTISNNEAVRAGGGIEVVAGTVTIVDTTIANNDASAAGGVILAATPGNGGGVHTSAAAAVNIDGSTVSGNVAREGGGLWNTTLGSFTVTNSTISGNTAAASGGGGVFNLTNGAISLDSVTITLNSATAGGGIAGGTGGVTLRNTIVAQNTVAGNEQNLSGGPIGNTGFNLIGDPDNGTLTPASVTNIFDAVNARLGPLQNNGGPTFTHLPLAGSPAIDFGDTVLTIDQRNVARPQGGADDIGAVEVDLVGAEVSAGAGAGDGNADTFRIVNGPGPNQVTVFVNNVPQVFDSGATGQLRIFGSSDDDTLTVDNSNGLIAQQIIFFGDGGTTVLIPQVPQGAGFDKLQLVGTTPADTIYNPGETNDAGAVFQTAGGLTQRVEFFGLEPVEVRGTGAGDTLTVGSIALGAGFPQALNADNAINYSAGPNTNDPFNPVFLGDLTGLITVDAFEGLEFSNFGTLVIDAGAGAGDDVINLNNGTNPTALANINIDGGDPTASDTVIVVGTTGTDTITYTPTDFNTATVAIATRPTVNLDTVEHIIYDSGEIVGFDNLTINGSIINDVLTFDAGLTFGGTHRSANAPDLDFLRTGRVTFNGNGGLDVVNYLGSDGIDTVTSTPTAVTLATPGSTAIITFGTAVEQLNLSTFAGNDSITLTTFAGAATVVNAGDGNDTVLGSTLVDSLYGGPGNDILVGGGGDDFLYGEEGNDIFGNTTLTPNGAADDAGVDTAFGGEGFDNFVWEPGDGADLNNGGGDGADIFRFFGNAAANVFILRSGGTATHFNALIGAVNIDNHGIEDVIVDGQGGGDTYTVDDLFATEVVSINLVTTVGAADTVTLNARNVSDNISLASPTATRVAVTGLRYNVNIDNATAADPDILIVNANDGNDTISSPASLLAFFTNANLRLNGGLGNDNFLANGATFSGGLGDDLLTGGSNNDVMDGGDGDDTFVGGGGTDNIGGGAGSSVGDTLLIAGTSGNDTVNLSLSATGQLIATVNGATSTYNNFLAGPFGTAGVEQILVQTGAGNDSLTVDSANGAVPVLITYDGGNNNDTLTLLGGTATSDTYEVGSTPDRGTSVIVIGGVTQTVGFLNIEPVIDLVAGPLVVLATNADNAINYGPGSVATNGLVSVDGFETIEFSNKTTLTINALSGNDTIAVSPVAPTGLTGVTINGNDPGAADTLVVSGTTAAQAFEYAPTGANAGTVTIATFPVITFGTISAVTIDGGSTATDDTLVVRSESGTDVVTLTPGANFDAGTVDISSTAGTESTPRLTFLGLGQDATLTLLSGAGAGVREDQFVYQGTANSDVFTVTTAGAITLNQQIVVNANNASILRLNGLNGDDTFTLPGNHPFAGGVGIDGGNPSAGSDVLNFNASATVANLVTVNFGASTIGEATFGLVAVTSIEVLNANAAGHSLTVLGTTGDDSVTVSPTGAAAATITRVSSAPAISASPVVNASALGTTFTVDLLAGSDTLRVNGTQAGEIITVTPTVVTVGPLKTVTYAGTEALQVFAQGGSDSITVTPSVTTAIFIDGGDPIGSSGDTLTLLPPGAFSLQPGPEPDEGGMVGAGVQRVSWDHIEDVIIGGGGPGLVLGTNGDDDITIIARDATTHAGTNGVQDFTVTVNDSFSVLFINQPTLFVDALAGDDDIVVRAPAPNGAVWNVQITLVGGPAASPTGDQGDVLEFETPGGAEAVIFSPTGPETGTITLDQATDSVISFVSTFTFDPAGLNYISSPGGIEQVVYDGVSGGGDTLTINGTSADDELTYSSTAFGGTFRSNLSPTFDFSRTGNVTFNGAGGFDTANLGGSNGLDIVTTVGPAITMNSPGAVVVLTIGTNVEKLSISTGDGSDNVDLDLNVTGLQKYVDAGNGDDIVNLSGTIDATILGGAGDDFLTGSPAYDYIDGGAGNDVIFGLAGNDDLYGGTGSDLIVGGAGADRMFGEDGADVLVWNPGDGNDLFEGGEGTDILQFVGGAGADTFTLTANGGRLRFDRQPGNIVIDAGDMEQVDVNSSISFGGILSGANVVPPVATAATGQAALVFNSVTNTFELQIVLQGITQANLTASSINLGAIGVNGAVIFDLGAGAAWNDVGGSLRRTVNLGAFPAANVNALLTGGTYVQVTTTANANDVRAQLTAVSGAPNLNGADAFNVNDLFGTGVQIVNLGLGVADAAAADTVTVNGRNVSDNISLATPTATRVAVTGLGYNVNVDNALAADGDILIVNGNDGNDTITSPASLLTFFTNANLRLNGGVGNDNILGNGATMSGGDGDDFITGGTNNDIMDGAAGDDTFVGGGGTDNVGGGAGSSVGDTILVAGTSGVDAINLSLSVTGQLVATVNGATTTYNNFVGGPIATSGIEQILVQAQNGNDGLTVNSANGAVPILITYDGGANNDLLTLVGGVATADTYSVGPDLNRGTSVIAIGGVTQQVSFLNIEPVIDLVGGPLVVLGTNANNNITYTQGPNAGAPVANSGLVAIDGFETIEFGNKTVLTINALLGNDNVTLSNNGVAAPTGLTQIIVTGGTGDDVIDASSSTVATPLRLYGGAGNDTLVGGLSGDLLYGELGNDTLVDSPGNDAYDGGNNGTVPAGFVFPALPAGVTVPAPTSDPITATGGFDTIIIRGTGGNDVLAATQGTATAVAGAGYPLAIVNSAGGAVPAATADVITTVGAADVPNALASRPSVEEVRIDAGNGNDEIIVAHSDAYVAATGTGAAPVLAAGAVPQQMVRFDVRGDSPNASDRLTVQDLGLGDLVLLRQAADQRTGRVTVAPAVNSTTLGGFLGDIVYTGIEKVNITPINPLNGGTGTNGLGQVVVFDTDPFEYNDNILNAEDIAHIELVTRNPNIDPGHNAVLPVVTPAGNGDEDWYAFTANQNGTFQINTLFSVVPVAQPNIPGNRPGLPGNGQLVSALYNAVGAATPPLVVGSTLLNPLGQVIGQQLQFAGVEGVTYYLRVIGTNATPNGLPAVGSVSTSLSVNTYDINLTQIDNLGPQVFDPDGTLFPAQAIQIVDAPLYNLFDNKQTFNSAVAAVPAPTIAGGVVSFTPTENLVGMQIGETVTFTTGVNAGLSDAITAISGNTIRFGGPGSPSVFALPAAGDAFYVGAATPTPNVNGLTINFRDPISGTQVGVAPGATLGALDPATALNPGNYILRGDANGIIPIQNVRFAVPSTGVIGGAVLAPVAGALNTTISLNAGPGLSIANGPIVGQTLQFTSGVNVGLGGRITGYNSATGEVRFSSPLLGGAPAVGDTFIISPSPIVISPTPVLATTAVTAASTNVVVNLGVGAVTGAGLSTVAGTYVGQALQIISGNLAGETRTITAYNGAGVFTVAGGVVANGFSGAPAIGDVFNIVGTPATARSTVAVASLANSIVGGAGLSAANGFYVGQALQFTSGPLSGQSRVITGYTIVPGIGPVFAFANGFTAAPAVGNAFVIVPAAPASLSNAVVAVLGAQGRFVGGAGLSPAPQAYLGQVLQFTSGALTGQAQVITDYANNIFAFSQPFTGNPAVGDTFNILPVNVAAITLDFENPLPDDRYTLTVSDELRDYVGNQLDGNSGASQPTGSPTFPSGDGISGGDFVARFNVDSRPELGTWAAGSMWADINGNQLFDPNNTDFTNRDFAYLLGYTSDELFAGNFANVGGTFADGFDKIAAYGRVGTSTWRWLIDTDNDGVPNIVSPEPAGINGFPVSGDFNTLLPGDEVGLFTGTTWFLDVDGSFTVSGGAADRVQLPWTFNGVQVNGHGFTGDFDGDGLVDLASWSNDVFSLDLTTANGGVLNGLIDTQFSFGFPGNRERPVAADMNRDGIDDIGLWVPDRATQTPGDASEWFWLISGLVTNDTPAPGGGAPFPATLGPTIPERVVADPVAIPGRNIVAFTPTPFGNDLYMQFGDEFSLPIVGNFDPPADKPTTPGFTNVNNPLDVNNDGKITAFDALAIINQLNLTGGPSPAPTGGFIHAPFLDVDGNNMVTAFDALQVINHLNLHPTGGAGEFVFENDLVGGEDTGGVDDELLMLLAADEDRD